MFPAIVTIAGHEEEKERFESGGRCFRLDFFSVSLLLKDLNYILTVN